MSKVSLKDQIEKVENQSLSGIYSKEDVLALLNNVQEDVVAPDGGIDNPRFITELEVHEIVESITDHLISQANNLYNAADYLNDPQFKLDYGTEIGIESANLEGDRLIEDIADTDNLTNIINETLKNIADCREHAKSIEDQEPQSDQLPLAC